MQQPTYIHPIGYHYRPDLLPLHRFFEHRWYQRTHTFWLTGRRLKQALFLAGIAAFIARYSHEYDYLTSPDVPSSYDHPRPWVGGGFDKAKPDLDCSMSTDVAGTGFLAREWIGCGKNWVDEDIPQFVKTQCDLARIPPEWALEAVPASTDAVNTIPFNMFHFAGAKDGFIPSYDIQPPVNFITPPVSTDVVMLRSYICRIFLSSSRLRTAFSAAWLGSCQSIIIEEDSFYRVPLWVETMLDKLVTFKPQFKHWTSSLAW